MADVSGGKEPRVHRMAELFGDRAAELVADESKNKRERKPGKNTWLIIGR